MMDKEVGFRLGVGMVIINQAQQVFWAKRADLPDAWQFPQGGIESGESPLEAMYRELLEEVGLEAEAVDVLAHSQQWYEYHLPQKKQRVDGEQYLGQRQRWFLLRLRVDESAIDLTKVHPIEFSEWKWVEYWYPLEHIVSFKRDLYRTVLTEFVNHLKV